MKSCRTRSRPLAGFTLMEVLVATTVLMLLLTLLLNTSGGMSQAWRRAADKFDSFSAARALFSLLERDVAAALFRRDLTAFPKGTFGFYTQAYTKSNADSLDRPLAYVKYGTDIPANEATPYLIRTDLSVSIEGNNDVLPWRKASAPLDEPALDQAVSRKLCEGVFDFRFQLINKDGNLVSEFTGPEPSEIKAVMVSIVIVSPEAQQVLVQGGLVQNLRSKLTGLQDDAKDGIKNDWDALIAGGLDEFPRPVVRGIHTFQRVIPMETSTPENSTIQ